MNLPLTLLFQLSLGAGPFVEATTTITFDTQVEAVEVQKWQAACSHVGQYFGSSPGPWRVALKRAATTTAFTEHTGRARFEAAAVVGRTIWIQPKPVFDRIPSSASVRRHECVHLWLRFMQIPPLARVVEESLAVGLSGQAQRMPAGRTLDPQQMDRAEQILAHPKNRRELESTLQDVVTTIWPLLRGHSSQQRLDLLRALSQAKRWTSVLLPVGPF